MAENQRPTLLSRTLPITRGEACLCQRVIFIPIWSPLLALLMGETPQGHYSAPYWERSPTPRSYEYVCPGSMEIREAGFVLTYGMRVIRYRKEAPGRRKGQMIQRLARSRLGSGVFSIALINWSAFVARASCSTDYYDGDIGGKTASSTPILRKIQETGR